MQGKNKKHKQAEEPVTPYIKKTIKIYSSLEEQERDMFDYWVSVSPLQRLAHLHEMILMNLKLTGQEAMLQDPVKKIIIPKP